MIRFLEIYGGNGISPIFSKQDINSLLPGSKFITHCPELKDTTSADKSSEKIMISPFLSFLSGLQNVAHKSLNHFIQSNTYFCFYVSRRMI